MHLRQHARRQRIRDDEPVVRVDQRELDEQQFREIGRAGIDVAEVGGMSSKAHQRVLGMPENETGIGMVVKGASGGRPVVVEPATVPSVAMPSSRSRLYQSSRPDE